MCGARRRQEPHLQEDNLSRTESLAEEGQQKDFKGKSRIALVPRGENSEVFPALFTIFLMMLLTGTVMEGKLLEKSEKKTN